MAKLEEGLILAYRLEDFAKTITNASRPKQLGKRGGCFNPVDTHGRAY
jgi:hypothetical protein